MDVRNCPRCGNIFAYRGFRLCESCRQIEDKEYEVVKVYLQKNSGTTVDKISEETGVSRQQILFFIRSGRLSEEVSNLNEMPFNCERCNKPILEGRICKDCQNELTQNFLKAQASLRKEKTLMGQNSKENAKIRYLDKSREKR